MAMNNILISTLFWGFSFTSCINPNKQTQETSTKDTITNSKSVNMNSYISMFEIPAADITRAINFYQTLLDIKIEKMDIEEMKMGILPYEGQMVTGVIIQADGYKPSANGVTIYLNAGDNLQTTLDKVENNGGKILVQKTAHADESGFFAIFLDTEGNKMALNSPN
ncbi:VOC family protein [Pseudopedobacter beijingensis]|uniref:VOC family protein n=1 Tax=Pseudopedobacter beijingensis TaxID=1207056 RepID=A0ABW4IBG0_9SPHI